jgi:molecular chaperone GrpE
MTDRNEEKTPVPVTVHHEEKVELSPEDQLEAVRQEAAEYKDKYLRAAAEVENTRKRLERQYANQAEEEKKRLLRTFLAVADNLERALTYSGDGLCDGVQLTYQELQRLLSREGVEPLEVIGQPFDPYYHEAVDTVVSDDDKETTVVGERQKGYLYRGELLRPAKVEVAIPASK